MPSTKDFILLDFLKKSFKGWKRLATLMVVGGVCGLIMSRFIHPIYESKAAIAVTIDYTRTGALSDIQEDQAMRGLGSVIDSDAVREKVRDKAAQTGSAIDENGMQKNFTLEREDFRWLLRVRDTSPEKAQMLANLWAEEAISTLNTAMEHAIISSHYQQYLDSLEYCLQRLAPEGMNNEPCAHIDFDFLSREIEKTTSAIRDEQMVSYGLMPALQFFLSERAPLNMTAVRGTQGTLIFSGAMLGFLIALLLPDKEKD